MGTWTREHASRVFPGEIYVTKPLRLTLVIFDAAQQVRERMRWPQLSGAV